MVQVNYIIKTISGLLKPISGQVVIGGEDLLILNEKKGPDILVLCPPKDIVLYMIQKL